MILFLYTIVFFLYIIKSVYVEFKRYLQKVVQLRLPDIIDRNI